MIDGLVERLEALRHDSLEYWATDQGDAASKNNVKLLAQKMKSSIHCLGADLNYYQKRYKEKARGDWVAMLADIADACTGGAFESANRGPEDARCLTTANVISKLRSELLKEKL